LQDIESRFAQFTLLQEYIGVVVLFFLVLPILSVVINLVQKRGSKVKENGVNFLILAGGELLNLTVYGAVFIAGLAIFESGALFEIPVTSTTWLLAIVVADLSYYWMHRIEHEVRILWALHSVHHSSEDFDLTTSLRLSWLEGAVEWIFLLPMILIGFDLVQTVLAFIIIVVYQSWIHTQWIPKLGILDKIFNTPSVHRVHHGSNKIYLDKNYGAVLMFWDHLFGTYQAETEAVEYGLTVAINTRNPIKVVFFECQALFKDCWQAQGIGNKLLHLFKGPGWKPKSEAVGDKIP
jgi:sterol desaturase/sphingolipid hydroxylase (fatty acid hydroxylase superfamily)